MMTILGAARSWGPQTRSWILPAACTLLLLAQPVRAAESSSDAISALNVRLDAAETRLRMLDGKAATLEQSTGKLQVADLFGESDEEKAARLQHEQNQDANIATLGQRVGDVEDSLRRLTGQIERLDHRLTEMTERIDHMQKDFDYKLCSLAAQQLGATGDSGDQNGLPCAGSSQGGTQQGSVAAPGPAVANEAPPPAVSGSSSHPGRPPGVLGTLPQNPPAQQAEAAAPPDQAASADAQPQFDAAMSLLAKADYDAARAAFRGFADSYPSDPLAPKAVYWVGAIAYVQKDYANAARAFAEELKKYPDNARAAQSMLKLGQSLIALNQKKEGCIALGQLPKTYPSASQSVASQAVAARKEAGCR
jgi:tol-pal system protein YbgF